MSDLKAGGVWTGGVYGAAASLRKLLELPSLDPGLVVACFDNGVPPKRLALVPDYKSARAARRQMLTDGDYEAAMGQINLSYEMFGLLGVVCVSYKEREADDTVGAVVRRLLKQGHKPVVVSSDKDMWQMVTWGGVRVWDLSRKLFIDEDNFGEVVQESEKIDGPIESAWWLAYRALVGDASDSIKGATGCGPKRASELIRAASAVGDDTDVYVHPPGVQGVIDYVRARSEEEGVKLRKFEQAVLDEADWLLTAVQAIDLSDSFGKDRVLDEVIARRPPVDRPAFLKFCARLKMRSLLLPRASQVFATAAKRRDAA